MIAIKVQNVSKIFRKREESYKTLREDAYLLTGRFFGKHHHNRESLWALNDISFSLNKGETLGIIGTNGSGKTTLLRLLAGITSATSGKITVSGKLSTLIDLTAGFHNELTGRENLYMCGSLLGMTKGEINDKFDSIVSFSEIGDFLDMPFKRYSSGMMVRLGFALDTAIEPEVLLVDEVLSVGDTAFQNKCHDKIGALLAKGCTLVMVSHNMQAIEKVCKRAMWLEKGRIIADGTTPDVISLYLRRVPCPL